MGTKTGPSSLKRCRRIIKYSIVAENNVEKDGSTILIPISIKTSGLRKKKRRFFLTTSSLETNGNKSLFTFQAGILNDILELITVSKITFILHYDEA